MFLRDEDAAGTCQHTIKSLNMGHSVIADIFHLFIIIIIIYIFIIIIIMYSYIC